MLALVAALYAGMTGWVGRQERCHLDLSRLNSSYDRPLVKDQRLARAACCACSTCQHQTRHQM